MKYKFYNGKILLPDMSVKDGEVTVSGDTVTYVGEKAPDEKYDREIDLKGNLLMPGFNDAHTHSAMVFLRSKADDMPLHDWLTKLVFPREDKLVPDDIYYLAKLAFMEYVSGGITSCFDMYFFPYSFAKAAEECNFRVVFCGVTSDMELLEEQYNKLNGKNPLISYKLGFHAEYTVPEENLKAIAALAEKYKAPTYTHSSETLKETEECKVRHSGMSPTEYFDSLGLYNYGGGGYHGVYLSDNDLEIYKKRNLSVVTNPCSNAKLASGIAPLKKIIDKGINLAVGTDGAASNNALDMFRENYLASVLQKLRLNDAVGIKAKDILKASLEGGAKAMEIKAGRIEENYLADLTVIDLNSPNMQPITDIPANLVYAGNRSNVILTMVGGKILYENGEYFIGEKPEFIYKKAAEISERIG